MKLVTPEEGGAGNNVQQGDQASHGPRHNWCPRFSLPNRVDPEHSEAGTWGSTLEHPGVVAAPDHQLAPCLPPRPEHHLVSISKRHISSILERDLTLKACIVYIPVSETRLCHQRIIGRTNLLKSIFLQRGQIAKIEIDTFMRSLTQ